LGRGNDYSNFNNIQTNLVNTPEADNFQANTPVNSENISVNNLTSQSHELHSAFTDDEVFKVNRIKKQGKERKVHPPAEGNLIDENSPIEDVQDFNVNTKSGVTQKLSQYNLKDRFINYILLKFPYVDIERLITLQQTDPYFQIIIEKCNSFSNKTCYKQGKHGFSFTLRQGILLRTYKSQEGLDRLQICCPKITLPDTLLTLHRQPNSIHIGIKKLCDKFEECFYSPDTKSYAIQVVENCFLCQSNLPIKRRIRGDYLSGLKLTLQGPGILWFTDVLQISNTRNAKYHSVLTFADGFTNFLIAVPFTGNMTNQMFMEIFQERVLTYYPSTKFLVSDNAKNISGNVVKQS